MFLTFLAFLLNKKIFSTLFSLWFSKKKADEKVLCTPDISNPEYIRHNFYLSHPYTHTHTYIYIYIYILCIIFYKFVSLWKSKDFH